MTTGSYGDNASGVAGNTETIRNNEAGGGALSVNGVRMQANNFILDGIDDNEGLVNTILIFPPIDALEEFRVITSVSPAQYGRGGGAMVVSSIKSGTNKIHGSAFEFYRSGKFDSNPNYRFFGAGVTPPTPIIAISLAVPPDYQLSRTNSSFSVITRGGGKPFRSMRTL